MFALFRVAFLILLDPFYVVGGGIHVSVAAAQDDLCRSIPSSYCRLWFQGYSDGSALALSAPQLQLAQSAYQRRQQAHARARQGQRAQDARCCGERGCRLGGPNGLRLHQQQQQLAQRRYAGQSRGAATTAGGAGVGPRATAASRGARRLQGSSGRLSWRRVRSSSGKPSSRLPRAGAEADTRRKVAEAGARAEAGRGCSGESRGQKPRVKPRRQKPRQEAERKAAETKARAETEKEGCGDEPGRSWGERLGETQSREEGHGGEANRS
jgi:hypothetical protein